MFTCGLERSNFSFDILSSSIYKDSQLLDTLEPAMRFELMTSSLPRRRSTPELRGPESQSAKNWSGRRDSNSRPSAWKADALPTELHPPKKFPGAGGRIRTYVGREPAGFTARCH